MGVPMARYRWVQRVRFGLLLTVLSAPAAWAQPEAAAAPQTVGTSVLEHLMSRAQLSSVQVLAHVHLPMPRTGRASQEHAITLTSIGSGVRFGSPHRVVTSYAIVADADSIDVHFAGETRGATLIGYDPFTDLALLAVEDVTPVSMAAPFTRRQVGPGEIMLLVDPMGPGSGLVGGRVTEVEGGELIFTDIKAYEGLSGAPMLDVNGDLVGVVTFAWDPAGRRPGVGRAVAVSCLEVERVVHDLERYGIVRRGYFGATADPDVTSSIVLDAVMDGGPAEAAGLRTGDVITHYGGRAVETADQLRDLVRGTAPGTAVPLGAWRDSVRVEVTVVLGNRQEHALRPLRPDGSGRRVEPEASWVVRWRLLVEEFEQLLAQPGFDPHHFDMASLLMRLEQELRQIRPAAGGAPPP